MNEARPLDVEGRLDIDLPGGRDARLEGQGDRVVLHVGSLRALFALRSLWRSMTATPMRLTDQMLERAGLVLEARFRGQSFLRIAADQRPSLWARIFGLPRAKLRLLPIVAARVSRPRR